MVKVPNIARPKWAWCVGILGYLHFYGIFTVPFLVAMVVAAYWVPHFYVSRQFEGKEIWEMSPAVIRMTIWMWVAAVPISLWLSVLLERPLMRLRCGPCWGCGRLGFSRVHNVNYPKGPTFLRCAHCETAFMIKEGESYRLNEDETQRFFGPIYYCRRCKKFSKEEKCEHCGVGRARRRLLDLEKNEYMREVLERNPPMLEETAAGT